TGLSVVKMVLSGLANTSLAPGTRGSLLVLSVLSDCGSNFEHPASVKTQINAASKMCARAPVLPRMIALSFTALAMAGGGGDLIIKVVTAPTLITPVATIGVIIIAIIATTIMNDDSGAKHTSCAPRLTDKRSNRGRSRYCAASAGCPVYP